MSSTIPAWVFGLTGVSLAAAVVLCIAAVYALRRLVKGEAYEGGQIDEGHAEALDQHLRGVEARYWFGVVGRHRAQGAETEDDDDK